MIDQGLVKIPGSIHYAFVDRQPVEVGEYRFSEAFGAIKIRSKGEADAFNELVKKGYSSQRKIIGHTGYSTLQDAENMVLFHLLNNDAENPEIIILKAY